MGLNVGFQFVLLALFIEHGNRVENCIALRKQESQAFKLDPAGIFHAVAEDHDCTTASGQLPQAIHGLSYSVIDFGSSESRNTQLIDSTTQLLAVTRKRLNLIDRRAENGDPNPIVWSKLMGKLDAGLLDQGQIRPYTAACVEDQGQIEWSLCWKEFCDGLLNVIFK